MIKLQDPGKRQAGCLHSQTSMANDLPNIQSDESWHDSQPAEAESFRLLFEHAPIGAAMVSVEGYLTRTNGALQFLLGYGADQLRQMKLIDVTHPDDQQSCRTLFQRLVEGKLDEYFVDQRYLRGNGLAIWGHLAVRAIRHPDGRLLQLIALIKDIQEQKLNEALQCSQKQVLEMIASGAPLKETLSALIRFMEAQAPEMLCSVLLLDDDGLHLRHGASPSLPEEYARLVDGLEIGPHAGTCGAAAYRREAVFVEDMTVDPLCVKIAALAARFGLRSCWSTPILNAQQQLLGTFAMFFRQSVRPAARQRSVIDVATHTATIAINHQRDLAALRENRERLDLVLQGAELGIWDWSIKTGTVTFNERWAAMLGYTLDEIAPTMRAWELLIHPDDLPRVMELLVRHLKGNTDFYETEHRLRHKSGDWVWVLDSGKVIERDAAGNPLRACGTHQDITNRKNLENAISRLVEVSARRYGAEFFQSIALELAGAMNADFICAGELIEGESDRIRTLALVADGKLIGNLEYQLSGTPCANVLKKNLCSFPANVRELFPHDQMLVEYGIEGYIGIPLLDSKGGALGLLAAMYRNPLPEVRLYESLMQIVAPRFGSEIERLRADQTRRLIQYTIEHSSNAISWVDSGSRLCFFNQTYCDWLGYTREELLALSVPDIDTQWSREKYESNWPLWKNGTGPKLFESELIRKDRSVFPVEISVNYVCFEGREYLVCSLTDITGLKQAREALQLERDFSAKVISDAPEIILGMTPAGVALFINPAGEKITGYAKADLIGRNCLEIFYPGDDYQYVAELLGKLEQGDAREFRMTLTTRGGEKKMVVWNCLKRFNDEGRLQELICFGRDVTRELELEHQLRQAHKMEAIGQLAGGVAHDFNNLLQVINGYTELALASLPENSTVRGALTEVTKAGSRAATLVGQLLAFSRRQIMHLTVLNLNTVIRDVLKMLERIIGEHIRLESRLAPDLSNVNADQSMMEQLLLNLSVNARDAMPASGEMIIRTANARVGAEYCADHPWAVPGNYVLLTVSDNGQGMDRETLSHIFEPFFTTKEIGKGTGLGLSTVYGIVKQHRGMIDVDSEPERGTCVQVYLPVCAHAPLPTGGRARTPIVGGTETILIAEDDRMVRELTRNILESAGYTVIAANDGNEVLELFDRHKQEIDLLLLDVIMPRRGGREVFEQIKVLRPELPVVFASGYSPDAIHTNFVLHEDTRLIQKPFTMESLLGKVREVLDQHS